MRQQSTGKKRPPQSRQFKAPPAPSDRLDTAPLIQFFRGPLLPVALTLFLAPLILALIGILSSFFG